MNQWELEENCEWGSGWEMGNSGLFKKCKACHGSVKPTIVVQVELLMEV
jgi:hypothetical protein